MTDAAATTLSFYNFKECAIRQVEATLVAMVQANCPGRRERANSSERGIIRLFPVRADRNLRANIPGASAGRASLRSAPMLAS
jgi:hypothetical protein